MKHQATVEQVILDGKKFGNSMASRSKNYSVCKTSVKIINYINNITGITHRSTIDRPRMAKKWGYILCIKWGQTISVSSVKPRLALASCLTIYYVSRVYCYAC